MLYVKSIESNIKKGVNANLGARTLLVGPNGSGKSSVVQAIELALGGFVSDAEGREQVKQKAALARLFPHDVKPFSKAVLSDNQESLWDSKTDPVGLVSFQFKMTKDLLASDASTMRSWLSERVSGKVMEDELLGTLVSSRRSEVAALIKREHLTIDFSVVSAAAKKASTALKREATATEKTIDAMVEGVSHPATAAEIEKAKAELTLLKEKIAKQHVQNQPFQNQPVELYQLSKKKEEILHTFNVKQTELHSQEQLKSHIEQLISTFDDASVENYLRMKQAEEAGYTTEVEKLKKVQLSHQMTQVHLENFGAEVCHVCGSSEGSIQDLHHAYTQHLNKVNNVFLVKDTLNAYSTTKTKIQTLTDELAAYEEAFKIVEERIALLEAKANKQAEEAEEAAKASTLTTSIDLARMQEITAYLAAQEANARAYQNAKAAKTEVALLKDRAMVLASAAVDLAESNKTRLVNGLADFQAQVSKYLCSSDKLGVDVEAGRIGFVRDQQIHTALSGAEWSRLLIALSCYDVERDIKKHNGKTGSTVFIVAPEDRAWDSITLGNVMKALKGSPAQIILMSTVMPEGIDDDKNISESWTIIQTA